MVLHKVKQRAKVREREREEGGKMSTAKLQQKKSKNRPKLIAGGEWVREDDDDDNMNACIILGHMYRLTLNEEAHTC